MRSHARASRNRAERSLANRHGFERGDSELLRSREPLFGNCSVAAAGRPGQSSEGIVVRAGIWSGDGPDQQRMTVEGTIKN